MISLVSYNIQYGLGQDGVFDIDRIAGIVAPHDIICLQEVEQHVPRSGDIDQAAALAAAMPRHHAVFAPAIDVDGSTVAADGTVTRRRRTFGNMVLSRWPILSTRTHLLPKTGSLDAPSMQRVALECVIDPGPFPLRVYSVHLDHVDSATRLPQARRLIDIVRAAPAEGGAFCGRVAGEEWLVLSGTPMPRAAILMGDFNCDAASPEYAVLTGPQAAGHGRLVPPDGLVDAWVAAGHDEASGTSHMAGRRIDHCFVSAWLRGCVRAAHIDTNQPASDHYPLVVDLDLDGVGADPLDRAR